MRPLLATLRSLVRPVLSFVATLAGAILLAQLLLWLAPGDAADIVASDPVLREGLMVEWGLDQPVLTRYARFVTSALHGDLGTSLTYRPGAEVTSLVLPAARRSLVLVLCALVVSMGIGVGLAFVTAGRKSASRRLLQWLSVLPVFLLAHLAMTLLNEWTFSLIQADRIPRPEWFALPDVDSTLKTVLAILVLAIGSSALTDIHIDSEQELLRVRRSGFIDAARARGAPLWPHLLWNLLPQLTTIASSRTAFFVGGLVIVEKVLQLNGIGSMFWQACRLRDYPLALGITVVLAAVVCAARLLGDLLRLAIDPRLRARA